MSANDETSRQVKEALIDLPSSSAKEKLIVSFEEISAAFQRISSQINDNIEADHTEMIREFRDMFGENADNSG